MFKKFFLFLFLFTVPAKPFLFDHLAVKEREQLIYSSLLTGGSLWFAWNMISGKRSLLHSTPSLALISTGCYRYFTRLTPERAWSRGQYIQTKYQWLINSYAYLHHRNDLIDMMRGAINDTEKLGLNLFQKFWSIPKAYQHFAPLHIALIILKKDIAYLSYLLRYLQEEGLYSEMRETLHILCNTLKDAQSVIYGSKAYDREKEKLHKHFLHEENKKQTNKIQSTLSREGNTW